MTLKYYQKSKIILQIKTFQKFVITLNSEIWRNFKKFAENVVGRLEIGPNWQYLILFRTSNNSGEIKKILLRNAYRILKMTEIEKKNRIDCSSLFVCVFMSLQTSVRTIRLFGLLKRRSIYSVNLFDLSVYLPAYFSVCTRLCVCLSVCLSV